MGDDENKDGCPFDEYDWVDRYDEEVAADDRLYARYDEVLDAVAGIAAPVPGRRILDIGAGTGTLAARLARQGANVVALDPSERMVAQARPKFGPDDPVQLALAPDPFLRIPYPDASFDAVVSTYAFHHVPHQKKPRALREMARVLRPAGVWVLGDLAFQNAQEEAKALGEFKWLEKEYFTRIEELRPVMSGLQMELAARQFTPVTWVLWAYRRSEGKPATADGVRTR
jgi:putative AdoMet-dependent methyltransferase